MSRTEEYMNGQAPAEEPRYDVNPNASFGEGDLPADDLPAEEEVEQAAVERSVEKKYTFREKTLERIAGLPKEALAKAGIHFDDYKDVDRKTGKEFTRRGLITRAEQQGGLFAKAVEHLAWGSWTDVPIPVTVFPEVLNREIPTMAFIKLNGKSGMISDFRIQNPNIKKPTVNEETVLNTKMYYFDDHRQAVELSDRDKLALYYQGGVGRLPGSSNAFAIHPGDASILVERSPETTAAMLKSKVDPATEKINGVYYAKGERHTFQFDVSMAKRFASGDDVEVKNELGEYKYLRYNAYTDYFQPTITTKYALDKADKYIKAHEERRVDNTQRQSQARNIAPETGVSQKL